MQTLIKIFKYIEKDKGIVLILPKQKRPKQAYALLTPRNIYIWNISNPVEYNHKSITNLGGKSALDYHIIHVQKNP